MDWDSIWKILNPIGEVIFAICSVLGALSYIKSFRKPKACLRFENGKKEVTLAPHYVQHLPIKYYVGPVNDGYDASAYKALVEKYNQKLNQENEFVLSFRLSNTGKLQLQDYYVEITYDNGIQAIGASPNPSLVLQEFIESTNKSDGVSIKYNKQQIVYEPDDKHPSLNQKDNKDFAVRFVPNPDVERIELNWHISAKDFDKKGKLLVNLTPRIDELDDIHFKNCERDVPEDGELIEDLMPYIQKMQKLVFDENTK